jgi:hypothetical protein
MLLRPFFRKRKTPVVFILQVFIRFVSNQ